MSETGNETGDEVSTEELADALGHELPTDEGEGHLDAEPVEVPDETKGDDVGDGDDYPVAHVVDLEVDGGKLSMCGEEIEGYLLEDRVLVYTCAACQVAMTARYNALADALLEAQLRLRVITQTSIGGASTRTRPLSTEWTRRVREVAADAQDAILEQLESGPRQ